MKVARYSVVTLNVSPSRTVSRRARFTNKKIATAFANANGDYSFVFDHQHSTKGRRISAIVR